MLDLSRFDGYEDRQWVVRYWGICCDTGKFSRTYRFETEQEALECYADWVKSQSTGGWSDGPDHMDEPKHVSELDEDW